MRLLTLALAGVAAAGSVGTFVFAFRINRTLETTIEDLKSEIETTKANTNKSIRKLQTAIAAADLEV